MGGEAPVSLVEGIVAWIHVAREYCVPSKGVGRCMEAAYAAKEIHTPHGHGHSLAEGVRAKEEHMETKARVVADICRLLGIEAVQMGVGSSVPRDFFSRVAVEVGVSDEGSATDVARRVALAGKVSWPEWATSEASPSGGGGTVTLRGLELMRRAVQACLQEPDSNSDPLPITIPASRGEWTLIEGQTTSREILKHRFGAATESTIVLSPWTDDVFVFFDPAGHSVINVSDDDVGGLKLHVTLDGWGSLELARNLLASAADGSSGRRSVRVFESDDTIAKYVGEFAFVASEPRWTDGTSLVLELRRLGPTSSRVEHVTLTHGDHEADKSLRFAPYEEADLALCANDGPWPFEVDPDLVDRALREHSRVQNETARWLESLGLVPMSPSVDSPAFDLAWLVGRDLYVAEVKTVNEANEQRQFRLGLGQVLDYAQELDARPVLVLSSRPRNSRLLAVASRAGVLVVWPELLPRLNPSLT